MQQMAVGYVFHNNNCTIQMTQCIHLHYNKENCIYRVKFRIPEFFEVHAGIHSIKLHYCIRVRSASDLYKTSQSWIIFLKISHTQKLHYNGNTNDLKMYSTLKFSAHHNSVYVYWILDNYFFRLLLSKKLVERRPLRYMNDTIF